MNLRKTITYGVPLALVAMLSAHSASAINNVYDASITPRHNSMSELRARTITGDTFNAELAREYKTIADYEWEKMYDWRDAKNHAAKGNLAAAGKTPMPNVPAEWNIKSKANLSELQDARGKLIASLGGGARTAVPALAAKAQANYDCWVEQQEEGHQPTHIAACKDKFWQAMADIDAAMTPKIAAVEAPHMMTTVTQEVAREVVFFDFDKAAIRPQELAKIDRFVTRMKSFKGTELTIVGHTDTSGSGDYNQTLSAGRARSVSNKLISDGMRVRDLSDMSVYAQGERQPAVMTANGVREQRNRRVEIVAFGQVEVKQQVSAVETR